MRSFTRSLQYLYFMRFSLMVWLFPLAFCFADSGWRWFPLNTSTLSRGIFVPEHWSGYCCVSFFLVCKGFSSLIGARTVVINGKERFKVSCPGWLTALLAGPSVLAESSAVILAQVPNLLALVYIYWVGTSEQIERSFILEGIVVGGTFGLLFCYTLNAWYYLSYTPHQPKLPGDSIRLGKNAARTILFPRWAFRLNRPGAIVPPTPNAIRKLEARDCLEDIETDLRRQWLAKKLPAILSFFDRALLNKGYFGAIRGRDGKRILDLETGRGKLYFYEAQIFVAVATIAFGGLFIAICFLTSPEPSLGAQIVFVCLAVILCLLIRVFWSGTCSRKFMMRTWQVALTVGSALFLLLLPFLYVTSTPDRFPVLATILLVVTILGWILSGMAFFLDRYRIPVLTVLVLLPALLRLFPLYGYSEEHFISIDTHRSKLTGEVVPLATPPTPAQILAQRLRTTGDDDSFPLVIVSATGGGLHASAWTARVLEALNEAFDTPSSSTTAAAFRKHILLMSTVSGGSVGLSYYLREIDPKITGGREQTTPNPRFLRMALAAQCSSLEAVGWGLLFYDLPKAFVPFASLVLPHSDGVDDLDDIPVFKDRTWALRKSFERNASNRYCLDTISPEDRRRNPAKLDDTGTLSRWERLATSRRSEPPYLQTLGGLSALGDFPAFTMNTTAAESGERFLLANYRLPRYSIASIEGAAATSFLDLIPSRISQPDLPVATAAQMSATFPYVSSGARLPQSITCQLQGPVFHFVDGGYYDNDGTASVIEFLRYALSDRITTTSTTPAVNSPTPPCEAGSTEVDVVKPGMNGGLGFAKSNLKDAVAASATAQQDEDAAFQRMVTAGLKGKKLRILLIEIRNSEDAATAPTTQATPGGLGTQLGLPLEAFWSAGHESITGRNRNSLDLLLKAFGDTLQLHHVVLDDITGLDSSRGIKTTKDPLSWSLTPRERDEVRVSAGQSGRLRNCYDDAIRWFANPDLWRSWTADQASVRCTKEGALTGTTPLPAPPPGR